MRLLTSVIVATNLLLVTVLSSCNYILVDEKELMQTAQEISEKAYFEGQRDALDGDIRIKMGKDSAFIWVKSPWNNGDKPIYSPTYLDSCDDVKKK
jgi:hypothetical protein